MSGRTNVEDVQLMSNIVIASEDVNAAATALTLAARGHETVLLGSTLPRGPHPFNLFGEQMIVELKGIEALDDGPTIGMVFAEGEDVAEGFSRILALCHPSLILIVGGGVAGVMAASRAASAHGFDDSRICAVSGFLVGGNAAAVSSEKFGLVGGFIGRRPDPAAAALLRRTLPHLDIGSIVSAALSSTNALIHVGPMIFNAMSVERGDRVRFYVEGFGDAVSRLVAELDIERLAVGRALGAQLHSFESLMDRYYAPEGMQGSNLREKINTFHGYDAVALPETLRHRFLVHEIQSTFAPVVGLAALHGIPVPASSSVVHLGEILAGMSFAADGRSVARDFAAFAAARAPDVAAQQPHSINPTTGDNS